MPVHRNSCAAYHTSDFSDRERAIIRVLSESSCPLTAREIAGRLGFSDLNAVRPRCTELASPERRVLCEAGDVRCPVSGKTVSTYALAIPVQQALI